MGRTTSAGVRFSVVRVEAVTQLERGLYTTRGNPRPCVWQNYAPSRHKAVYCNVLSHLESLEDLLRNGQWCDDAVLEPAFSETDDCIRLFRYYGLVFLAFEECVADLRLIRGAARGINNGSKAKVEPDAERIMGFVNHVWKHRNAPGQADAFHRLHHHGPYLFADCAAFENALPGDGAYLAMGHTTPSNVSPPVPLVVPSLISAMNALRSVLLATSTLLRHREARRRVESQYGTIPL
jgi:hypothetical protein